GQQIRFRSERIHPGASPAVLEATWTYGEALPEADPDSLTFFLTERYCLYTARGEDLYRARIHHPPWPLQAATLDAFTSSMAESHGLPTPTGNPLLHYAAVQPTDVWPIRKVTP